MTTTYNCCFNCVIHKSKDSKNSKNSGKRCIKASHEKSTCNTHLKTQFYAVSNKDDVYWMLLQSEGTFSHTHDLMISNMQKINSYLQKVTHDLVVKGHNFMLILNLFQGASHAETDQTPLEVLGGCYMICQHIVNTV